MAVCIKTSLDIISRCLDIGRQGAYGIVSLIEGKRVETLRVKAKHVLLEEYCTLRGRTVSDPTCIAMTADA